ncbi:RNA-binding protein [Candidatus Saccharibacteria bacterium]|nr:RNA-binding protein [Candidatus Saccharibacteria bacterium]
MSNKLYVGSLPYATTEADLTELFGQVGTVQSAKIIMNPETGQSKGFGFVEMASEDEANAAIEKFNDSDLDGRKLVVSIARPMTERPRFNSRDRY